VGFTTLFIVFNLPIIILQIFDFVSPSSFAESQLLRFLQVMNVIMTSSQGFGYAMVWFLSGAYKNLDAQSHTTRVNTVHTTEYSQE
jgi:hypothetical protein